MNGFFTSTPTVPSKIYSFRDAVESLDAFNAITEADPQTGSVANRCDVGDAERASWCKAIREGVINVGGRPTELDFFERMAGGPTRGVEASEVYIKTRGSRNWNIVAKDSVTGSAPGASATFTLLKNLHSPDGKFSPVSQNSQLFDFRTNQNYEVIAVNKTVDYAHTLTVVPVDKNQTVSIVAGAKYLNVGVRFVGGLSCLQPAGSMQDPGYVHKVQSAMLRRDWEIAEELDRPFKEVAKWALVFDKDGRAQNSYEANVATQAREDFQLAKNMAMFVGYTRTNASLTSNTQNGKYAGFMGLMPTLRYGGGQVYDFDAAKGSGLTDDFQSLMIQNDASKLSKEWMANVGLRFRFSFENRNSQIFKDNAGSCTFETFKRGGVNQDEITRLEISSYKYAGFTLHLRTVDAWTDERLLGHGMFPNMAHLMPTMGLTDDKGRSVPPIEFFAPGSIGSTMQEIPPRRHLYLDSGCDKISGTIRQQIMMSIHGAQHHILLNPVR